MNLTQAIKAHAHQLGFSLAGVTTADALPHEDVFYAWLEQGKHGEMAYMGSLRSRQCRAHPRGILPACRSVLVLAVRYPQPISTPPTDPPERRTYGRVAAYAWAADYHEFIPARLKELVAFIESQVGHSIPNRWYTDTGPLLERELAQRAGLGWIGKNTCLIHPQHGSYFLLAEILLGIELEPDPPFLYDRCGTCTRCLIACPTGCILPDRTIDARRCISYLTIELKGPIPPQLRHDMGSWVFGCDICQQVCPWNHFAASAADSAFRQRLASPEPDLLKELALDASSFNHSYRHSPVVRAKRRGYLRNVSVALGNAGDPAAVPALAKLLQADPEPLVRAHAAWALGQIGAAPAIEALRDAMHAEVDPQVKQEILAALSTGGTGKGQR